LGTKYTKEVLEEAVRESVSIAGVLRKLGLAQAGGTHSHLSRSIKAFGINTSHFLGKGANRGPDHRGPKKLLWWQVLVIRQTGRRRHAHVLRRVLIESGRPYRCATVRCPVAGQWLDRPIMLQVNHKNRNWLDDRAENLEFLCGNCHSQTEHWCGRRFPITSAT
jgi:hypothetical protein